MPTPPEFLLVDPSHFDVSYTINPWMQPDTWARDPQGMAESARRASAALAAALRSAGAKAITAPGAPGLPDMVFPANSAVVMNRRAVLGRFRHPQRRGEEAANLVVFRELQQQGLLDEVVQLPEGCFQEGAGDCMWDASRQLFWCGYGPRSSRESIDRVGSCFSTEMVPLELTTQRFYHLDVGFVPLSGGEILYYPGALSPTAHDTLRDRVAADDLIVATDEDAAAFSVNAINFGREIVMCTPPGSLRARLEERGYHIHAVDLTPFMLSGGGAYCMTLRLDCQTAGAAGKRRIGEREPLVA